MKINIMEKKIYEVTNLQADCEVRYWEDASVDRVEDADGSRIPCRIGDSWCPLIELATGRITNWTKGVSASIHYKICDAGTYSLLDASGNVVVKKDGYVPRIMCPKENGYGDYVIMDVSADGIIQNWKSDLSEFEVQS